MRLLVLKTVLVATDLDDSSLKAVEGARALAKAAAAELHVVSVATDPATADGTRVYDFLSRAGIAIDEASVHAVTGNPVLAISRLAETISADVIVLGPHCHDDDDRSPAMRTALGVATRSAVPCLIVPDFEIPLKRVTVAIDLSETARGALLIGLSWASALRVARVRTGTGATLTVLHVASRSTSAEDLASITATLDRQVRELRETAGSWSKVTIDYKLVVGDDAPAVIAGFADAAASDLIVLGTRGIGLDTTARVGSVAASVAEATKIPTLLVPPAVWLELARVRPRQRRRTKTNQRAMP